MWTIAATWCMSLAGTKKAAQILSCGGSGADALEALITDVEDDPRFQSVGYGGLPDLTGHVCLDGGFMDGRTLKTGAVMALESYASPFRIARQLASRTTDNVLCGSGAAAYAEEHGFAKRDNLIEKSYSKWQETKAQQKTAYRGHDTVGALALDTCGNLFAGTSTSGLFMKLPGRVGDTPMPGSGFYADNDIGAACATGLGEDLMKGCISYEIVRQMKAGIPVQTACENAVRDLHERLSRTGTPGDLSVIAIDKYGNCGAASNIAEFSFVTASAQHPVTVSRIIQDNGMHIEAASEEWIVEWLKNPK
ncbi:MAG TPA: N(4)-(beta-N-acetylglucosaminyl)-L-asparaginase [Erysipelotrichaceae bacterium]|nr:N(4)-(beta-N-acetylglucosaminyl)-L-asparaginase [Erysipelotrichaceae bacterium]